MADDLRTATIVCIKELQSALVARTNELCYADCKKARDKISAFNVHMSRLLNHVERSQWGTLLFYWPKIRNKTVGSLFRKYKLERTSQARLKKMRAHALWVDVTEAVGNLLKQKTSLRLLKEKYEFSQYGNNDDRDHDP